MFKPIVKLQQFAAASVIMMSLTIGLHADERAEHLEVLKEIGIATDTASLISFLKLQVGDIDLEAKIAALIADLGSDRFAARQEAWAEILLIGSLAKKQLTAAAKSSDAEVAYRATQALGQIDSAAAADRRTATMRACLFFLKKQRAHQAVPMLFRIVDWLGPGYLQDTAIETIWACAAASQVMELENQLKRDKPILVATAIVAMSQAVTDETELAERLKPFLKHEQESVRLAACRALIDVLPSDVVPLLVQLTGSATIDTAAQADALLTLLTGVQQEFSAEQSMKEAWQQWQKEHSVKSSFTKLADNRLDLNLGRRFLEENFSTDLADATAGYGKFKYLETGRASAAIKDGILYVHGTNPEADQRFVVTSDALTGRSTWPDKFEVRAKLGGGAAGSGGYHVGVSVGNLKAIFHPSYRGGGFRMETVDNHDYIVTNTDLGFTPTADVLHTMRIKVRRAEGKTEMEVEITEGNGNGTFQHTYEFDNAKIGDFNSIGLERSGRTGGSAVFDDVLIQLGR